MCFSASASFSAATVLIPMGVYAVQRARRQRSPYWAFAVYPLAFGIQQAMEGWLWLVLGAAEPGSPRLPALFFMFFSHFFWLFWVPLSSALSETVALRRRLFLGIALGGGLYGLYMYLPLLLFPDWVQITLHQHSIVYHLRLFFDEQVPQWMVRALYAVLVLLPLLGTSHPEVRRFGVLILASVLIAALFFEAAFVSVWCFFAAIISSYLLPMLRRLERQDYTS